MSDRETRQGTRGRAGGVPNTPVAAAGAGAPAEPAPGGGEAVRCGAGVGPLRARASSTPARPPLGGAAGSAPFAPFMQVAPAGVALEGAAGVARVATPALGTTAEVGPASRPSGASVAGGGGAAAPPLALPPLPPAAGGAAPAGAAGAPKGDALRSATKEVGPAGRPKGASAAGGGGAAAPPLAHELLPPAAGGAAPEGAAGAPEPGALSSATGVVGPVGRPEGAGPAGGGGAAAPPLAPTFAPGSLGEYAQARGWLVRPQVMGGRATEERSPEGDAVGARGRAVLTEAGLAPRVTREVEAAAGELVSPPRFPAASARRWPPDPATLAQRLAGAAELAREEAPAAAAGRPGWGDEALAHELAYGAFKPSMPDSDPERDGEGPDGDWEVEARAPGRGAGRGRAEARHLEAPGDKRPHPHPWEQAGRVMAARGGSVGARGGARGGSVGASSSMGQRTPPDSASRAGELAALQALVATLSASQAQMQREMEGMRAEAAASVASADETPFYERPRSEFLGTAADPSASGLTQEESRRLMVQGCIKVGLTPEGEIDMTALARLLESVRVWAEGRRRAGAAGHYPASLIGDRYFEMRAADLLVRLAGRGGEGVPASSAEWFGWLRRYVEQSGPDVGACLALVEAFSLRKRQEDVRSVDVHAAIDLYLDGVGSALSSANSSSLAKGTTRALVVSHVLGALPAALSRRVRAAYGMGSEHTTTPRCSWSSFVQMINTTATTMLEEAQSGGSLGDAVAALRQFAPPAPRAERGTESAGGGPGGFADRGGGRGLTDRGGRGGFADRGGGRGGFGDRGGGRGGDAEARGGGAPRWGGAPGGAHLPAHPRWGSCHICKSTSHYAPDCPEKGQRGMGRGRGDGPAGAPYRGGGARGGSVPGAGAGRGGGAPGASGGQRADARACFNCGGPHMVAECPQPPKCRRCGRTGHLGKDCPQA